LRQQFELKICFFFGFFPVSSLMESLHSLMIPIKTHLNSNADSSSLAVGVAHPSVKDQTAVIGYRVTCSPDHLIHLSL